MGGTVEPAVGLAAPRAAHRLRVAARRITADCEFLLADATRRRSKLARDAIAGALVAAHELRAVVERIADAPGEAPGPGDGGAPDTLRDAQQRIVRSMTRILASVPTSLEDELLLADARAIRDQALRLHAGAADSAADGPAPAASGNGAGTAATAAGLETVRSPRPSVPTVAEPARARILVVDDSDAPRRMLKQLVGRLGHDVTEASGGHAAFGIATQEAIDLVISDIEMPEGDGFELLQRLKADERTRDVPVIMVSGLDDTASVVRCIEAGADDHIPKPFDAVLLRARLRSSLEQKRLRDRELAYLRRVAGLTAAALAVEDAAYEPGSLDTIAAHDDELGRLARVFDRLVLGFRAREAQLERRLDDLKREVRRTGAHQPQQVGEMDATTQIMHRVLAERYEVIEELGRGGMGRVYRARDRELGEEVAVKVVRHEVMRDDPALVDRLRTESRLARRITHRNVVRVFDVGEHEGTYFLTMELVRGITIESLLESRGRLGVTSTLAIATQLADALAVAHEQDVIHRDVKPANLLVDDEGVLKVMDFGLARLAERGRRLTQQGIVVGTPRYMAPEQLLDGDIDARTDLYAMGVVLYECLTGVLPFDAPSPVAMVARMVDGPPTPVVTLAPEVSAPLAALVGQLLAYDPAARPASAREVADRLRSVG
ncbi:MAG: protein kinase [Gemmatimonadota bacterium]|nr:protein kinase [Gemmatimonadota bacterium]